MKKLLLCGVAAGGLIAASAPAQAQIDVTVSGHTKNYVGWLDQDTATGNEERSFDMLRESEIHFNAEGVADNGLTYGFHVETEMDGDDSDSTVEESYLYLSSAWGRVNLGSEDGANYLLQVAAPSADANIDGIRQYIQPVNYEAAGLTTTVAPYVDAEGFDYENDATGKDEKITYMSPVWNGFQLGASYTHDVGDDLSGLEGFNEDDEDDDLGEAWEGAVRYEGQYNNVGFALGAGYTHIEIEEDANNDSDDFQEWNVGADLDIGPFGLGAVYTEADGGAAGGGGTSLAEFGEDADTETWVFGGDYTTGPFKLGASYFTQDSEDTFIAGEVETDRYTGGVIYTAAPGLTFRGSLSFIDHEIEGADDVEATSVLGGVQFNF